MSKGKGAIGNAIAAAQPMNGATSGRTSAAWQGDEIGGFEMRPTGLVRLSRDPTKQSDMRISGYFDVLGRTRNADNEGWGLLLRWKDPDGVAREWIAPAAMLAGEAAELRARLAGGGLWIAPHQAGRQALIEFLTSQAPKARVRTVPRAGWYFSRERGAAFVLPGQVIGEVKGETVMLELPGPPPKVFRASGTLKGWQAEVAAGCVGNSRLLLAVSIAFAPPLLRLLGEESGGVNLRGESRRGKSTALKGAASVWGPPEGHDSFVRGWRSTGNALEAVAAEHNDCLLPLDEIGQVEPRELGEISYMLGNGQGKARAQREGHARGRVDWQLLFLSTGEKGLAEVVAEAGKRMSAGQEVRLVDVPAEAGKGLGLFENLHDAEDAATFAEELKQATVRHHGTAGPAFLAWLAPKVAGGLGWPRDMLAPRLSAFLVDFLPPGADGQVRSVARRFALIGLAGELATEAGVTGWAKGAAWAAAGTCFRAWLSERGSSEGRETLAAVEQVRACIAAHGQSRFEVWRDRKDDLGETAALEEAPHEARAIVNRLGFKRWNPDAAAPGGGYWTFYFLPSGWREATEGLNAGAAAQALAAKGFLRPGAKQESRTAKLPGFPKGAKVYEVSGAIMGSDADD